MVGWFLLKYDSRIEFYFWSVMSWYLVIGLITHLIVQLCYVVQEPFCLIFKVLGGDVDVPSAMRGGLAGGADIKYVVVIDQTIEHDFHSDWVDSIYWDGSNRVNEGDLFFDTIVVGCPICILPLIFDECLVHGFACCGNVFCNFVVSTAMALYFVS